MSAAIRSLLLPALLAAILPVSAQVYRWVDENGQVHFGSQAPRESTAERYKVEQNYEGDKIERDSLSEIANPRLKEERLKREREQELVKARAEACKSGRDYQKLLAGGRFQQFVVKGSLTPRALSEEEFEIEQQRAEDLIKQNCD